MREESFKAEKYVTHIINVGPLYNPTLMSYTLNDLTRDEGFFIDIMTKYLFS